MPITTKDSILKQYYEANGQQEMFGRDNLQCAILPAIPNPIDALRYK